MTKPQKWNELSTDEAYRLSQAEFKGMTLQALQDLKEDIRDLKQDRNIRSYISYGIAMIAGLISGQIRLK